MNELRTREQIQKTVFELLSEIAPEIDPQTIRPDQSLRDQIDIDSIDFLSFITKIHQRLGVEIPESDYRRLTTLENMVSYLSEKLVRPASSL